MVEVCTKLYAEGGVGRFYQGLTPALIQGPISRFGDTAANEGAAARTQPIRRHGLAFAREWGVWH